jgi:hypothetical protein
VRAAGETYPGWVLDLSSIDLEEIANALTDQTDYEHHWLINPETGEIAFWTADTGIDGQTPVDLDDLDLVCIHRPPDWRRCWAHAARFPARRQLRSAVWLPGHRPV